MQRLIISSVTLLTLQPSWLHANAEALKTPNVVARLGTAGLRYCWGEGGICDVEVDMRQDCSGLIGDPDYNAYDTCVCGSGLLSVMDACHNCELADGDDSLWFGPSYTSACESIGVTIVPIPSNVLSQQSKYNATYTGIIPGKSTGTGTGASITTTKDNEGTSSTTTSRTGSTTGALTWYGGTTGVETLGGGSAPTMTRDITTTRHVSVQTTTASTGVNANKARKSSSTPYWTFTMAVLSLFVII